MWRSKSELASNGPVVKTAGLRKVFGAGDVQVQAVREVSLEIMRGEMVALMGPSGSGKTTLLNLLGCVDRPTSGSYWLDEQDVSRMSDRQLSRVRNEKIGFVFQTFNLLPRMTALQNVGLPTIYGRRRRRARPLELLQRVGIAARARHLPAELSGGEQQRVALARALINDPAIILADEPTGNLDSHSGAEVMRLLQQLNEEGVTILLVTHDAAVARHAKRLVQFRDGEVVADEAISDRIIAGARQEQPQ
jgi:putative ABC transport system ATP-binding protein